MKRFIGSIETLKSSWECLLQPFQDEVYRRERKQILENFCQREKIYFTNHLFHSLEAKARQNLQAEIETLSSMNFPQNGADLSLKFPF